MVTTDGDRMLRGGWTEIKYWLVVRTLYVRDRSLYSMRSFIFLASVET